MNHWVITVFSTVLALVLTCVAPLTWASDDDRQGRPSVGVETCKKALSHHVYSSLPLQMGALQDELSHLYGIYTGSVSSFYPGEVRESLEHLINIIQQADASFEPQTSIDPSTDIVRTTLIKVFFTTAKEIVAEFNNNMKSQPTEAESHARDFLLDLKEEVEYFNNNASPLLAGPTVAPTNSSEERHRYNMQALRQELSRRQLAAEESLTSPFYAASRSAERRLEAIVATLQNQDRVPSELYFKREYMRAFASSWQRANPGIPVPWGFLTQYGHQRLQSLIDVTVKTAIHTVLITSDTVGAHSQEIAVIKKNPSPKQGVSIIRIGTVIKILGSENNKIPNNTYVVQAIHVNSNDEVAISVGPHSRVLSLREFELSYAAGHETSAPSTLN
jgi:hypothetical protein